MPDPKHTDQHDEPEQALSQSALDARRRYQNAKRRALYWSGNPSFSARRPTGKAATS